MVTNTPEYMREYFAKSESVVCECGGHYKKYQKSIHLKTQKHKRFNNETVIDRRKKTYPIVYDDDTTE